MSNGYKWNIWKILTTVVATVYFFYVAQHPYEWHFLDAVNLIFHEAGHTLALAFPQFWKIAAGTLFQLFIPVVCYLHLHHNKHYFSSYLILFWVGQNLINISIYARDAQTTMLPLLGGDGVIHDWNYMLGALGLLNHTILIANSIFLLGIITITSAAVFSLINSKDKYNPNF